MRCFGTTNIQFSHGNLNGVPSKLEINYHISGNSEKFFLSLKFWFQFLGVAGKTSTNQWILDFGWLFAADECAVFLVELLHGIGWTFGYIRNLWCGFAVLVPPIFEHERDACHSDADKDDNENAANVLNRNTIWLILHLFTLLLALPPIFFEFFQITLVQQLKNSTLDKQWESYNYSNQCTQEKKEIRTRCWTGLLVAILVGLQSHTAFGKTPHPQLANRNSSFPSSGCQSRPQ